MSLRSKLIGILLSVCVLYAFVAWVALELLYTSAFNRLESDSALNQIGRISNYIDAERTDVDLLVNDWANWTETYEFVNGEHEDYYEEHLSENYLSELGMSFGVALNSQGGVVWSEVYTDDGEVENIEYLFPQGIGQESILVSPHETGELVSGLISTAHGPAIISSAAVFKSDGLGPPSGHFIVGKLMDFHRLQRISDTMLTSVDILPVEPSALSPQFHSARNSLVAENVQHYLSKQEESIYALSLLRDLEGRELGLLRIGIPTDISTLGASTIRTTIWTLIVTALILTLTLWVTLKSVLLCPIEHLTRVFKGRDLILGKDDSGQYLVSTIQQLADSRGSISKRDDEIGELIGAFDELSASLHEATTNIWRVAHLDGLTELANRRLFMERLNSVIESLHGSTDSSDGFTVQFVDLDYFKNINDKHGHEIGDQLLIAVANRLQTVTGINGSAIGPNDDLVNNIVARIGGDEFVLFLPSSQNADSADTIASRIVESMSEPFIIEGITCNIGACVGIAEYPEDAVDVNSLLSIADAAMYEAKRAGKSCWRRSSPSTSNYRAQKRA